MSQRWEKQQTKAHAIDSLRISNISTRLYPNSIEMHPGPTIPTGKGRSRRYQDRAATQANNHIQGCELSGKSTGSTNPTTSRARQPSHKPSSYSTDYSPRSTFICLPRVDPFPQHFTNPIKQPKSLNRLVFPNCSCRTPYRIREFHKTSSSRSITLGLTSEDLAIEFNSPAWR